MGGTSVNSSMEVWHWLADVQIVYFNGNQPKHVLGGNPDLKKKNIALDN